MDFPHFFLFLIFVCVVLQTLQTVVVGDLAYPIQKQQKNKPKIINGTEAKWDVVRYQVSVRLTTSEWFFGAGHICGGSLIAPRAVLTAGHCIWSTNANSFRNASEYSVVMGNLNRYQNDNNSLVFGVTKIAVHHQFNPTTYESDVAVLHLNNAVPMNFTRAYPIPLNTDRNSTTGAVCQVSGWGRTETGGYSPNLMVVDVAVVSRSVCALNYGEFLRDGMICAGYMEGGRDACVGDSGGPMVCGGKVWGVVSFGVGCAQPGYPGVYADVASYADWIHNQTNLYENVGFSGVDQGDGIGIDGDGGHSGANTKVVLIIAFVLWFAPAILI